MPYFHFDSLSTLCVFCLDEKNINFNDCLDARAFCHFQMKRYLSLLDSVTFMPCEHFQKEKEFGIRWRSAFKTELYEFADSIHKLLVSWEEQFPRSEPGSGIDPFEFFKSIVEKETLNAALLDAQSQADLMAVGLGNLEILEKSLCQVKAMLKEPELAKFEEAKSQALDRLRIE